MATRKYNQNTYVHGQWNAVCDICGFKFKASDLKKNSDGFMVCAEDYEPEHPSDNFRMPQPNPSIPWVRMDAEESGGTDINGNTFPPTFDAAAKAQGTRPDSDGDGLVEGDNLKNGEVEAGTVSKA